MNEDKIPPISKIMEVTGMSSQMLYKWREERPRLWHIIILGVICELSISGKEDLLDD